MFGLRCPHCGEMFKSHTERWSEPARQRRAVVACSNPLCGASFLAEISPYEDRDFAPINAGDLFNYRRVRAADRLPSQCCDGEVQLTRTTRALIATAREIRAECRACGKVTRMIASLIAEISPPWQAGSVRPPPLAPPSAGNATDLQQTAVKKELWITRQAQRLKRR